MLVVLTLVCILTYIAGLILLVKITPGLIKRAYDDALFVGVAAGAIFGAMLVFTSVGVTYVLFTGNSGVRIFDALLLIILLIVSLRTAIGTFRPRYGIAIGTYRASRIMTGSFFLVLSIISLYVLVLLFTS